MCVHCSVLCEPELPIAGSSAASTSCCRLQLTMERVVMLTVRYRNAGRAKLLHLALRFTTSGEMPLGAFPYALHCPKMLRKIGTSTAAGPSRPEAAMPQCCATRVAPFTAQWHGVGIARDVRRYAHMPDQAESPSLQPRPMKRPPPAQVKDIPVASHSSVLNKYLAPGKLLEFRNLDSFLLGLVVAQVRKENQPSSHCLLYTSPSPRD